ncbi:MAG: hypothetical protein IIC84_05230 [Chloroflexi bacterium]|nr:hypothetical protein [Chloroflexota bacterium]
MQHFTDYIRKHPRLIGIPSFIFIWLPGVVEYWWALFSDKPLVPTLIEKLDIEATTDFSLAWFTVITAPIGLLLLSIIIYQTRFYKKEGSGNHILVTIVEQPDEKGYFDYAIEMPKAQEQLKELLDKTSEWTAQIGKKMNSQTKRILRAQGDPEKLHKITTATARDLDKYSDKLVETIPKLESACEEYKTSWSGLIDWWNKNQEGWQSQFDSVFSEFVVIIQTTAGTIEGVTSFRESTAKIMEYNLSGSLTSACRRLLKLLDSYTSVLQSIQTTSERVISEAPARVLIEGEDDELERPTSEA